MSTGDPEMVQLVLQYRDYQRATQRLGGIPELLNKLRRVRTVTFYLISAHFPSSIRGLKFYHRDAIQISRGLTRNLAIGSLLLESPFLPKF